MTEWIVGLLKEFDPASIPTEQLDGYGVRDRTTLTAECHRLFKRTVFNPVEGSLMPTTRDLVRRDREGGVVDRCVHRDTAGCRLHTC